MPTTSVTIDWGILSLVGISKAKEKRDGLHLTSGVLMGYEKAKGKGNPKWDVGGRYPVDVILAEHTTFTDFSSGYETYSGAASEPGRTALYSMAESGATVKISGKELRIFQSGNALAGKVERDVDSVMGIAERNWTRRIIAGQTGAGFDSWNTLNGIDVSTGFIEENAVASQTNSVGGLSKATYNVRGWTNPVQDMSDAFGSNGLNALYSLLTAARRYKDGGNKIWLASDAGINNIKRSSQAYERFLSEKEIDPGRKVTLFQGIPIFQEPQMPVSTATGGSASNTNPMTFLLLDCDDIYPVWAPAVDMDGMTQPDGFFGAGEFQHVSRQNAWEMPIHVAGQLVAAAIGSSGLGHSGETF